MSFPLNTFLLNAGVEYAKVNTVKINNTATIGLLLFPKALPLSESMYAETRYRGNIR